MFCYFIGVAPSDQNWKCLREAKRFVVGVYYVCDLEMTQRCRKERLSSDACVLQA